MTTPKNIIKLIIYFLSFGIIISFLVWILFGTNYEIFTFIRPITAIQYGLFLVFALTLLYNREKFQKLNKFQLILLLVLYIQQADLHRQCDDAGRTGIHTKEHNSHGQDKLKHFSKEKYAIIF